MEVTALVNDTHILLIVADNLNEVTHDIRKEGHSTEHNDNCNYPLSATNWVIVSIPDSTQGSQCIIATDNELMRVFFLLKLVISDECDIFFLINLDIAKEEPEAPNKVDDNSNNDESEYLINVHQHVLSYYLFVSRLVFTTHEWVEKFIKSTDVNQLDQSWKPKQPQ